MNGSPVTIGACEPSPGQRPILMEVPVTDGDLVLRYRRQLVDWLGMALSLLAAAGLGWLLWRGRWPWTQERA